MSVWDGFLHRVRTLLRPRQYGQELADEQRFHLELDAMHGAESLMATQVTAPDHRIVTRRATERAHQRFGNVTTYAEETRAMAGLGFLDMLSQDTRFAWRSFRRSPAFSIVAVLTLGIGIGANTAIFSAMDALLFRPLPFEHPEQLMKLSLTRRRLAIRRPTTTPYGRGQRPQCLRLSSRCLPVWHCIPIWK